MAQSPRTQFEIAEENLKLKAQVAQLEDRLDHLVVQGSAASALKEAAEALAQQEKLYQLILVGMSDVVLIANDSGQLTHVSPNVHLVFGYSQDDVLRQKRLGFLLPNNLFDADVLTSRGEISNIEHRIRDSIGRARDLLITVKRVSVGEGTVLYMCRDVSERKHLEAEFNLLKISLDRKVEERTQELQESREKYRRLVEGLRDEYFFYATDPAGTISYVSPSITTILGYTPDEVVGRNWREFVRTESDSYHRIEEHERMRFAGLPTPIYEAEVLHASGQTRRLEVRDVALRDVDGQVVANEGICKDITLRYRAEQELQRAHDELERRVEERTAQLRAMNDRLRDSEHRYRSVVEDSPDFIVRWKGAGTRTFVNDAYCRYLGQTQDELIGTSFLPAIVEEDREVLERQLSNVTTDEPSVVLEYRITMPDGRLAWQRWSHRGLFDKAGELVEFQAVGSDITDHRTSELQERERAIARTQVRSLTSRESDVLRLVVAGDANKVIARKLDLSIKTIEKHRSSLMRKLQVRSVPELVRLAMLAGVSGEVD